jgi:predicted CoA-binding protein
MSAESEILKTSHVIAVVGLSRDLTRPSCRVADYLRNKGYKIIPVNPNEKELMGEKCYPDLISILEPVDVVDIFRKSEDVKPVVEEAIKIKAKTVWMQQGIINDEAAELAKKAGLKVVMDKCMRIEVMKMQEER